MLFLPDEVTVDCSLLFAPTTPVEGPLLGDLFSLDALYLEYCLAWMK